ncbi:hypothetical protein GE118_00105 [Mycoplasma sp. NEAQ87857]|uniref:hypothetical protein n=1 Tax=Mycoplasma sp. NEAQ87857 TaxID=2683967 RepID=UPI0013191531|nr:hypothetical protein [Mycoplasma sp. NEAQ87857]QGZ97205.1 hypothetical protein GE118_00105 [Mycoplasma sp. NEAQ87857]
MNQWNNWKEQYNPIKLVQGLKNNVYLQPIIQKLEITDQELLTHYTMFSKYCEDQKVNSQDRIFDKSFKRNDNNQLVEILTIAKTTAGKEFMYQNYIKNTQISKPIIEQSLDKLEIDSYYDLSELKKQIIRNINNISKLEGYAIEGQATSIRREFLSSIVNYFALNQISASYIDLNYLDDKVKNLLNSPTDDLSALIDSLIDVDVLVIDELGFKKYSKWFLETIFIKVLDQRIQNNKLTYIGSYYSFFEIKNNILIKNEAEDSKFWLDRLFMLIRQNCHNQIHVSKEKSWK